MHLRNLLYLSIYAILAGYSHAGALEPLIVDRIVHAPSLEQSLLGTSPDRQVRIYLPPGYYESDRRYPVVYVLHGHSAGIGTWHGVLQETVYGLWGDGAIQPMILVAPDVNDAVGGSYYANTPVTGNWEDFITRDLVDYVDGTYRTLPQAASRGLLGVSMGGFGAMRLGMLHPDVFSVVYARSGAMGVVDMAAYLRLARTGPGSGFCAAFDPNPDRPPDFFDRFDEEEDVARMAAVHPLGMLAEYADNPKQLRGIAFDAGTQDEWSFVLPSGRAFSAALTEARIDHFFEEYVGNHSSAGTVNMREKVIPFLAGRLEPDLLSSPLDEVATISSGVVQAAVGGPTRLEWDLRLDAGVEGRLELDLASMGSGELVPLSSDGDGHFAGATIATAVRSGHYDLPIWLQTDGGKRQALHFIALNAWPQADLVIADEAMRSGWSVETSGGAQEPLFAAPLQPARGDLLAAFPVEAASFVGWTVRLTPAEAVNVFGYEWLAFSFHPGDATGRSLLLQIGDDSVQLVGPKAGEFRVDLGLPEWQRVEVPLAGLDLFGSVASIQFSGDLKGTFYLDGLRLVAGESPPLSPTAVVEGRGAVSPAAFALQQNYPNPFNSNTVMGLTLPAAGDVELAVYNLAGQKVATLVDGPRSGGAYTVRWDGRDDEGRALASGKYMYRLQASDRVEARKLLLLR